MSMNLVYNKKMGFAINGVAIPDPASYGYKSQSVDVSAERDTKALLHRKMVAVKYNVSLSWSAMDYDTASSILNAVRAPKFTFTFPCPEEPLKDTIMWTYNIRARSVFLVFRTMMP